PKQDWLYAELGVSLYNLNRVEEALSVLNRALELNSNNAWALRMRSEERRVGKGSEEAISVVDQALALDPKDAITLGIKVHLARDVIRDYDVIEAQTCALPIYPKQDWLYAELGASLYNLNRVEEALSVLNRALELNSNNAWALRM